MVHVKGKVSLQFRSTSKGSETLRAVVVKLSYYKVLLSTLSEDTIIHIYTHTHIYIFSISARWYNLAGVGAELEAG